MEIRAHNEAIEGIQCDVAVLSLFEDGIIPAESIPVIERLNAALDNAIAALIQSGEIKGKANETTLIHTFGRLPAKRIVVIGLGKREDLSLSTVRQAAGTAARFAYGKGCRTLASLLHGSGEGLDAADVARSMVEGTLVGLYTSDLYKTDREIQELKEFILVDGVDVSNDSLERAFHVGRICAEATNMARDLCSEPANILTPTKFAERARSLFADTGATMRVLEETDMRECGMGALLAVASGSQEPAKLIQIVSQPVKDARLITFVGKGITFDSGGISIKPSGGMEKMKYDMSGAAAVLAATWAVVKLELPLNIMAIIPLSENLPGGRAYRPGDVLKTLSGKTVEVITTDAEGRLILSDALAYAVKEGATHVIDFATLTGSCVAALADQASGLFSNDEDLAEALVEVGEQSSERLWRLPLFPGFREKVDGKISDLKNSGGIGDVCNAAAFLREFVSDKPWAHIDIAGTAWLEGGKAYIDEGPTGVGTGIIIRLAERLSDGSTQ